jgi:hypothetical protein
MESRAHTTLACVLVGAICLTIGYFAGREHIKYEMRSAIESAAADFRRALNLSPPAAAAAALPVAPTSTSQPPASVPKKAPPVTITLVNKGFKDKNIHAGDFEEDITLSLSIKNLTKDSIRAFDGVVAFTDLLDNKIMSIRLAVNDPIEAGKAMIWQGGIKYNEFMDDDQRLRSAEMANMKVVFTPHKVLLVDGTTTVYDGT